MPRTSGRTTSKELRTYLTEWLGTGFCDGTFDRNSRAKIFESIDQSLGEIVQGLNQRGQWSAKAKGDNVFAVYLRECADPDKGPFNFFEVRTTPLSRRRSKIRCFVGHRFTPAINKSLRSNLRYVLEPHDITLDWSGKDMRATGFFDDILDRIKNCKFCIFDTRNTDEHPNVHIEAGIAYALKRPFILAEYQQNRLRIPSDLGHVTTIRYKDYRTLMKDLYFKMPVFLNTLGLRG